MNVQPNKVDAECMSLKPVLFGNVKQAKRNTNNSGNTLQAELDGN